MKKIYAVLALISLLFVNPVFSAEQTAKRFEGSGEVLSVDPMYGRITIRHGVIKGFLAGGDETEFVVTSSSILKDISKRDLVDFVIVEEKGDDQIEKITKTGQAPIKEEGLPIGRAVQGVLEATGEAAKTVTTPITPVHDVVSGAVGATTDTTGVVLDDANPDVKKNF